VQDLKNYHRGRLAQYAQDYPGVEYTPTPDSGGAPSVWSVKVDVALPCATQVGLSALGTSCALLLPHSASLPPPPNALVVWSACSLVPAPLRSAVHLVKSYLLLISPVWMILPSERAAPPRR